VPTLRWDNARGRERMKYLFNLLAAYEVEADTADNAFQMINDNLRDFQPIWEEITLIEKIEGESK